MPSATTTSLERVARRFERDQLRIGLIGMVGIAVIALLVLAIVLTSKRRLRVDVEASEQAQGRIP